MSNERGFSILKSIGLLLGLLILAAVIGGVLSNTHRAHDVKNIQQQMGALNLPVTTHQSCANGDGVDSGAECSYSYNTTAETIGQVFKNAGFTPVGNSDLELKGGSPALLVQIMNAGSTTNVLVSRYTNE